jgi:hypothetical protein
MTGQRRSTRFVAVIGVVLVATLAMAACSSDDDNKTSTSGSSTSSSSAAQSSSLDETAAKAEITTAVKTLYDGTKDLETKLATLEDPELIRAIFTQTAQQNADLLKQTQADVKSITFTDNEHADVTYDLVLNGIQPPQLPNQIGGAVLVNGQWKVSTQTFCDIAALGNSAVNDDPACA